MQIKKLLSENLFLIWTAERKKIETLSFHMENTLEEDCRKAQPKCSVGHKQQRMSLKCPNNFLNVNDYLKLMNYLFYLM